MSKNRRVMASSRRLSRYGRVLSGSCIKSMSVWMVAPGTTIIKRKVAEDDPPAGLWEIAGSNIQGGGKYKRLKTHHPQIMMS